MTTLERPNFSNADEQINNHPLIEHSYAFYKLGKFTHSGYYVLVTDLPNPSPGAYVNKTTNKPLNVIRVNVGMFECFPTTKTVESNPEVNNQPAAGNNSGLVSDVPY